ncbi:hypothetical protein Ahia01_001329000 [Argonauta hians]
MFRVDYLWHIYQPKKPTTSFLYLLFSRSKKSKVTLKPERKTTTFSQNSLRYFSSFNINTNINHNTNSKSSSSNSYNNCSNRRPKLLRLSKDEGDRRGQTLLHCSQRNPVTTTTTSSSPSSSSSLLSLSFVPSSSFHTLNSCSYNNITTTNSNSNNSNSNSNHQHHGYPHLYGNYVKKPRICGVESCNKIHVRWVSEEKKPGSTPSDGSDKKQLIEAWKSPYEGLDMGQKVKEASKDLTYTGVIIIGVGITAVMLYAILKELLSRESPNAVFSEAFKRCKSDPQVQLLLGEPIKAYGEETGRRRRRHVSHAEFKVGDTQHLRLRFYIEGPYRKATVNLEKKQNESGKYDYRYLFVQSDSYPNQVIVIEDNR